MTNDDHFLLRFDVGEAAAQSFAFGAETLDQVARQANSALTMLYDSGLRGTFLASFEDHSANLLNTLRVLVDEIAQTGRNLQRVVERARLLDAQTALRWMQGGDILLPDAGGGSERAGHIGASIARLEALQVGLRAQLADVQRQKDSPVNVLLGLRDDYEAIEGQLNDTLARNTARIEQLKIEQQHLEQAGTAEESPLAALLREQSPAATGQSGFGELLEGQRSAAIDASPQDYTSFVHRQYNTGDTYGCSLYAQSSVLEAMGFDFENTLNVARTEGITEGWYDATTADGDGQGTEYWGLGDVFESNGIPYDKMGGTQEWSGGQLPDQDTALARLHSELQEGHFPVVSFQAADVALYNGQHVEGHTFWVTGVETDAQGRITSIIANDSHFGKQVTLPANQFANAWKTFNYQAVFARRP